METVQALDNYLALYPDWEKTALVKDPFWLKETREKSLASFRETGFPTREDESWKHTSLDDFYQTTFHLTQEHQVKDAVRAELESQGFDPTRAHLMVFVNGHFNPEHSSIGELPRGAKVRSLIESLADGPLKRYFSHILPFENRPFVALNYAFFTDGVFLHLGPGVHLNKPLHLVYLSSNSGLATQSHLRNLLLLEEGSSATVIEHYWGNNLNPYFTNSVTKVALEKDTRLDHTKIQRESALSTHIGSLAALQSEGSRLTARVFSLGGLLGRSEIETSLAGPPRGMRFRGAGPGRGQTASGCPHLHRPRGGSLPQRTGVQAGPRRAFGRDLRRPHPGEGRGPKDRRPAIEQEPPAFRYGPGLFQTPAPDLRRRREVLPRVRHGPIG